MYIYVELLQNQTRKPIVATSRMENVIVYVAGKILPLTRVQLTMIKACLIPICLYQMPFYARFIYEYLLIQIQTPLRRYPNLTFFCL